MYLLVVYHLVALQSWTTHLPLPALMASAVHAAQPQPPVPSFSRNSTGSSVGGPHLSQLALSSFEASQSVVSTPAATPPSLRGQQRQMSFNMVNFGPSNGLKMQQNGLRGYAEVNGSIAQQVYPPGHKPSIYTVCCLRLLLRLVALLLSHVWAHVLTSINRLFILA